jgi:hypothetical protein
VVTGLFKSNGLDNLILGKDADSFSSGSEFNKLVDIHYHN